MQWYSVKDKLPRNKSIVWVRRLIDGAEKLEIAIFDSSDICNGNVTHWQKIIKPSKFNIESK